MELNQTEFLPSGIEFVGRFRLQHGDITQRYGDRGQLAEAQVVTHQLLNWMLEREIIDSQHHHDVSIFQIMQEVFRNKQGRTVVSRYGQEKQSSDDNQEDNRYLAIIKQLTKNDIKVIEWMLLANPTSHTKLMIKNSPSEYVKVLNKLSLAISRLND